MKKVITYLFILTVLAGMTACGTVRSVSDVGDEAEISRDKSIYKEVSDDSPEKQAARECWEYLSGENGKEADYYKAAEIISEYEDSDDPDVLYCLGFMHMNMAGLPYDIEKAKDELERAELGGNYYASIQLGILFEEGTKDIDYDYVIARDYYRRAILNGLTEGYYGLGRMYCDGHGMEKDMDKAIEYFNKVINEGTSQYYINASYRELGGMYYYGDKRDHSSEDDDPEYDKAIEYFEKITEGEPNVCVWYGYMYEMGLGFAKDVDKAVEYYEKAANCGDCTAMRSLGWLYVDGENVDRDVDKALEWYNKAADLNDPKAYFELGQIYEGGVAVDKDETKAQEYYDKAYAAGYVK